MPRRSTRVSVAAERRRSEYRDLRGMSMRTPLYSKTCVELPRFLTRKQALELFNNASCGD